MKHARIATYVIIAIWEEHTMLPCSLTMTNVTSGKPTSHMTNFTWLITGQDSILFSLCVCLLLYQTWILRRLISHLWIYLVKASKMAVRIQRVRIQMIYSIFAKLPFPVLTLIQPWPGSGWRSKVRDQASLWYSGSRGLDLEKNIYMPVTGGFSP
jgi:hypothetical protein